MGIASKLTGYKPQKQSIFFQKNKNNDNYTAMMIRPMPKLKN